MLMMPSPASLTPSPLTDSPQSASTDRPWLDATHARPGAAAAVLASAEEGLPLPADWQRMHAHDGRILYVNRQQQAISWTHPAAAGPLLQPPHEPVPRRRLHGAALPLHGAALPLGWDAAKTAEEATSFVDSAAKAEPAGWAGPPDWGDALVPPGVEGQLQRTRTSALELASELVPRPAPDADDGCAMTTGMALDLADEGYQSRDASVQGVDNGLLDSIPYAALFTL
jgi:hypothetical protein